MTYRNRSKLEVNLTTIIVTRTRVELLCRALRSLELQQLLQIEVIIIVDDCLKTSQFLETIPPSIGAINSIRWINIEREANDRSGPKRLATLRNIGLQIVETSLCSFLDDDNELEPTHFFDLLRCLIGLSSPAAHSWRSLWTLDGKPFLLKNSHPWCRDPELAKSLFSQYRDAGIYQIGSNVVRDQVIPYHRDLSMVDMSEWVFKTEFIRRIGFVCDYCEEDRKTSRTEDSKLLDEIVARGLKIPSTKKPTLRYYMGGYSNNWLTEAAQIEGWL